MSDAQGEMIFEGDCESGLVVAVYGSDGCEQMDSQGDSKGAKENLCNGLGHPACGNRTGPDRQLQLIPNFDAVLLR